MSLKGARAGNHHRQVSAAFLFSCTLVHIPIEHGIIFNGSMYIRKRFAIGTTKKLCSTCLKNIQINKGVSPLVRCSCLSKFPAFPDHVLAFMPIPQGYCLATRKSRAGQRMGTKTSGAFVQSGYAILRQGLVCWLLNELLRLLGHRFLSSGIIPVTRKCQYSTTVGIEQ